MQVQRLLPVLISNLMALLSPKEAGAVGAAAAAAAAAAGGAEAADPGIVSDVKNYEMLVAKIKRRRRRED